MESRELIPGSEADIRVRTTSMEISISYYAHLHHMIEKNHADRCAPTCIHLGNCSYPPCLLAICAMHIFRWSPCVLGTVM